VRRWYGARCRQCYLRKVTKRVTLPDGQDLDVCARCASGYANLVPGVVVERLKDEEEPRP